MWLQNRLKTRRISSKNIVFGCSSWYFSVFLCIPLSFFIELHTFLSSLSRSLSFRVSSALRASIRLAEMRWTLWGLHEYHLNRVMCSRCVTCLSRRRLVCTCFECRLNKYLTAPAHPADGRIYRSRFDRSHCHRPISLASSIAFSVIRCHCVLLPMNTFRFGLSVLIFGRCVDIGHCLAFSLVDTYRFLFLTLTSSIWLIVRKCVAIEAGKVFCAICCDVKNWSEESESVRYVQEL